MVTWFCNVCKGFIKNVCVEEQVHTIDRSVGKKKL